MRESMSDAMLQERKRRKKRKIISVIMAWLLAILIFAASIFCIVTLLMAAGGKSLRKKVQGSRPNLRTEETQLQEGTTGKPETGGEDGNVKSEQDSAASEEGQAVIWQEGWVRHQGKIYEYNEEIMTFLVLGIDKEGKVKESTSKTGGGQSDAIFLVIANPLEKDINILAINRDTMTEISMYGMGPEGSTVSTVAQLAAQHGFGDGKEQSCELTRDAVSALLYDLPIHGYVSVNMGAIAELNDVLGGVEVCALEDIPKTGIKKGEWVTLKGMDAFWYVKYRNIGVFESNRGRLARQKQYLNAFMGKMKEAVKADITLPVELYQKFSKYMVTDISLDEVTYLAGELLDYQIKEDAIYTMEGETRQGEKYEEFYPDMEALKNLMITLFYREVEGY